jgi:hypothetical protein
LGDVDSLILKNISNKTNGSYYGVNNANSLKKGIMNIKIENTITDKSAINKDA